MERARIFAGRTSIASAAERFYAVLPGFLIERERTRYHRESHLTRGNIAVFTVATGEPRVRPRARFRRQVYRV